MRGEPRSAVVSARLARAVLGLGVALVACGPSSSATVIRDGSAKPAAAELTVFAAASLRDVAAELAAAYERQTDVPVVVATDSSATLRTQIEQGAPADVFLSADTINPAMLAQDGLTTGDPLPFAGNTLAIIVPSANAAGVETPADLARPGLRIVAAGSAVPITTYANEVVTRLAGSDGYPADFARAYAANIVSREDNVQAVVTKIVLGEGDAAIVYATDAAMAGETIRVEIPAAANVTATYAGVVIAGSARVDAAHDFLDWLVGAGGQAILARHGFLPPAR
jgi:molybdate transport system substrate-binding protein